MKQAHKNTLMLILIIIIIIVIIIIVVVVVYWCVFSQRSGTKLKKVNQIYIFCFQEKPIIRIPAQGCITWSCIAFLSDKPQIWA